MTEGGVVKGVGNGSFVTIRPSPDPAAKLHGRALITSMALAVVCAV